jgi:sugar lactone lactonase YvrE
MSPKRTLLLALALLATALSAVAVAREALWHIDLPNGYQPEGIASGRGHELFVGSIPTGAVRRVDTKTGVTTEVVPAQEGRAAIGLKADRRGRLFVAGGPTGKAFVYSRRGENLAEFQLAPAGQPTFVNDVVLTRHTAYFTDSQRQAIYAVAPDLSGVREIGTPDIPLSPGNNLNGIAASANGMTLLAGQGNVGALWRIDPRTGAARQVDLGGATLLNADGLLLEGRTLYVVQNRFNQIAVVRLDRDLAHGSVERTITSPDFDVPTTIARQARDLYAVNARFGTAPTPDTQYWITRVAGRR